MADANLVQHPNPELLAAPNAAPDEPAPAEQLQPAGQAAAVPAVNQQELEMIILFPRSHDLRSLLFLFLLRNHEPFLMIQRGKAVLEMLVDYNWNRLGVVSFVK